MVRWLLQTASVLVLVSAAQAESSAPNPATSTKRQDGETAASSAHGLPLRLTLLDPTDMSTIPSSLSCQDSPEETMRLQSLVQLSAASLPVTRRLTLHSFSRWGCPSSAGAGGGVTYAIELSPKMAMVLAAGVAVFPHAPGGRQVRPRVRADLQWTTKDGETRSVGIDMTQILKSAVKAGVQRRAGASISGAF
jgi:hypothetical protein